MIEVNFSSSFDRCICRMVFTAALVSCVLALGHPALAQKSPAHKQQVAVEFSRLIERWQKTEDVEEGIAALEAALKLEPKLKSWPRTLPLKGSRQQVKVALLNGLGATYYERRAGDRANNLDKSIAAYEAALAESIRETLPRDWADIQHNLALTYTDRIRGDLADNLEKAIGGYETALTIRTREALPKEWAVTQHELGFAYVARIRGDRADNFEKAIAHLEAALTVRTRDGLPQDAAMAQKFISEWLLDMPNAGQRWAKTENTLGLAYFGRIRGDHADNLEKAIAAYEATLTVFTREHLPKEWATIQTNRGLAYQSRIRGDRADNLENAVTAYEAALTVRKRETLPHDWALTQFNLGNTYSKRIRGDRANNLENAIAAYEAVLAVYTREREPRNWADAQHNLAVAYAERIRGDRADNLDKAIAAYKAVLTVATTEALPRHHLNTAWQLGEALLEKHEWRAAGGVYAGAREAFLLQFGQGLDEAEAQDLISLAGPLFSEAAYAAVERGELESAISLLSEGKARLLAVALRQQSLDLPPDKRARYAGIRAEIPEWSRRLETAKGTEALQALERLTALRRELGLLIEAPLAVNKTDGATQAANMQLVQGGVIVAPIVTKIGGKILLVRSTKEGPKFTAVDLPELNSERLEQFIRGDRSLGRGGGWLGAYKIQYLPLPLSREHMPEWLGAIEQLGGELWGLFGQALDRSLQEHGVNPGGRLIWLPTGALGLLPVGLTQDPLSGRRLGEAYEIAYVPSLQALAASMLQLTAPTTPSLAAAINPTGEIPDLALPFTEIEGALVAAHFTGKPNIELDKSTATPDLVLAALKDKSYWHFSRHGRFNWDDPKQSGLLMRDRATLTLTQLLQTEGRLGHPRLVALSACETGLYDIDRNPEEFIGLPAAFMQIGATGVLSSLWQVDDLATALLMAKFYDLHLDDGLAPSAALKVAQAWLRQATKGELIAYGQGAAGRAKLDPAKLAELVGSFTSRSWKAASRFASVWEVLHQRSSAGSTISRGSEDEDVQSRPFRHPYYWGAFIYTGL